MLYENLTNYAGRSKIQFYSIHDGEYKKLNETAAAAAMKRIIKNCCRHELLQTFLNMSYSHTIFGQVLITYSASASNDMLLPLPKKSVYKSITFS